MCLSETLIVKNVKQDLFTLTYSLTYLLFIRHYNFPDKCYLFRNKSQLNTLISS